MGKATITAGEPVRQVIQREFPVSPSIVHNVTIFLGAVVSAPQ